MSLPQPNSTLTGACSVIYDNVLYAYSADAFQSLELEEGAEWKTLDSGESVQGGVCVGSTPSDSSQAGLYIVGGTSSDSAYMGLQKFTYSTGKWESITFTPQISDLQNRKWHSATYLNASDKILVYAGATDDIKYISTQTFTISASSPYQVLSYESDGAPPAIAPILLPWSDTDAVMIAGESTNTKVMLFNPDQHWYDSGASLASPIVQDTSVVKGMLVTGDDGSKHLYTFDATTSPNTVNRTVLWDGSGAAVASSVPIQGSASTSSRRALDASDWPTYNSTLASDTTRSDYSLASDSSGMAVLSGGNDDDVLSIFDGTTNSWQNATALLVGASVHSESEPQSSSSSASSTATASSTAVAAATQSATTEAAASSSSNLPPTSILGIALGVIFGCAIVLIALLFLMKRKRQKQAHADGGQDNGANVMPEKQDYFAQDIPQSKFVPGHAQQDSQSSFSSMAILMGRAQKPGLARKGSKDSTRSDASSILNRQFKATISRPSPIPEPEFDDSDSLPTRNGKSGAVGVAETQVRPRAPPIATKDDGTRRSSGWNRYWSGGTTLNMLGFGNGSSRRETQASEGSRYSDMHRMTQDSATVPPLHVEEGRPSFSQVHTESPTVSHYSDHLKNMQTASLERPVSEVSSSGYSSGIPPSIHEQWDPATINNKSWGHDRAPSSAYSQSIFPSGPRTSAGINQAPSGVSRQPQLTMAHTSDMSWLNLGENARHSQSQ
ncbi:hypothetical protein PFICI_01437 [Pestalotiopsis fici W106-1]|uniref:Pre-mRNA splicing factor CLF1 n=1 Tax=Pestalotiopsis fici (strain W106-1 / CGMCC3.15140) TaxID=1229662 RepID=W3XNQ5_PESFW|nr:uncharacterized protein PFICI_01437 [Pestalotiopsis fici W106-1]ETS87609.1 hypothetical protein PFICI_01437 [Pestalotiopsis fici W106-1]